MSDINNEKKEVYQKNEEQINSNLDNSKENSWEKSFENEKVFDFNTFIDNDDLFNSTNDCNSEMTLETQIESNLNESRNNFNGIKKRISEPCVIPNDYIFNFQKIDDSLRKKKPSKTTIYNSNNEYNSFNYSKIIDNYQKNNLNKINNLQIDLNIQNGFTNINNNNNIYIVNNICELININRNDLLNSTIQLNNNICNYNNNMNNIKNNDSYMQIQTKKFNTIQFHSNIFLNPFDLYLYILEYNLNKISYIDINIFNSIKSKLIYLIKTQNGCKIIQKFLYNTSAEIIHLIFEELCENILNLLLDPIANYFCIKLFFLLNPIDNTRFFLLIIQNFILLSINKVSTHFIQLLISQIININKRKMIIQIVNSNLLKFSFDIYGCHIIEKIIICYEPEICKEIYKFIINNFVMLSNHVNGLCLIKQFLIIQYKKEYFSLIKKNLIEKIFLLIENPYGNYALQIVINFYSNDDIFDIFKQLFGQLTELSMMKFSSNVIERLLEKSEVFTNYFIQETCFQKKTIGQLIKNNFGNYVVQTCLKSSKNKLKEMLINSINNNLNFLEEKKLIIKWKNILSLNIPICK